MNRYMGFVSKIYKLELQTCMPKWFLVSSLYLWTKDFVPTWIYKIDTKINSYNILSKWSWPKRNSFLGSCKSCSLNICMLRLSFIGDTDITNSSLYTCIHYYKNSHGGSLVLFLLLSTEGTHCLTYLSTFSPHFEQLKQQWW